MSTSPSASAPSPSKSVLDIFTAKGSWDPVFVVAPARLVGLQNEAAARERGQKRARQVAWHRIDGPEVRSGEDAKHVMMTGGAEGGEIGRVFLHKLAVGGRLVRS